MTDTVKRRDALAGRLAEAEAEIARLKNQRAELIAAGAPEAEVAKVRTKIAAGESIITETREALVIIERRVADEQAQAEKKQREETRRRFEAAEGKRAKAVEKIEGAVAALAEVVREAEQAESEARIHASSIATYSPIGVKGIALAVLFRHSVVESQALAVSVNVLRALDPVEQERHRERDRVEREQRERQQAIDEVRSLRDAFRYAGLKIAQWTRTLDRHPGPPTQKKIAEWTAERDAAKARLLELGEVVVDEPAEEEAA